MEQNGVKWDIHLRDKTEATALVYACREDLARRAEADIPANSPEEPFPLSLALATKYANDAINNGEFDNGQGIHMNHLAIDELPFLRQALEHFTRADNTGERIRQSVQQNGVHDNSDIEKHVELVDVANSMVLTIDSAKRYYL